VVAEVAPGNHEYSCGTKTCSSIGSGFTGYINKFALPLETYGGSTPMWYSFHRGNAHWVVISTETDYPHAFYPTSFGNQLQWLDADLKAAVAARAVRPWIFVVGHRPVYTSMKGYYACDKTRCWPTGDGAVVQGAFESLLLKYNVDMYISGHVHSYSRTYPIAVNGTSFTTSYVAPKSPVYLNVGCGGNEDGLSLGYNATVPWAATFYEGWGFGIMSLSEDDTNSQHNAQWTFYASSDGSVQDSFKLTKPY